MILYSSEDDTAYEPPAPILERTIRKVGRSAAVVTLLALIDSGADATMIPITELQKPVWLVSHTPLMATLVTKLSFVTRVAITG
jgi:hypothetical protein